MPTKTKPVDDKSEIAVQGEDKPIQVYLPKDREPSLSEKLALIYTEVERLQNTARNTFLNFNYAPVQAYKDMIRPLLGKYGVVIIPHVVNHEVSPAPKDQLRHTLTMKFEIKDGRETIEVPWVTEATDKGDFGITKALTLATKYFLSNLFLISSSD
jgi:hypothetical protein